MGHKLRKDVKRFRFLLRNVEVDVPLHSVRVIFAGFVLCLVLLGREESLLLKFGHGTEHVLGHESAVRFVHFEACVQFEPVVALVGLLELQPQVAAVALEVALVELLARVF